MIGVMIYSACSNQNELADRRPLDAILRRLQGQCLTGIGFLPQSGKEPNAEGQEKWQGRDGAIEIGGNALNKVEQRPWRQIENPFPPIEILQEEDGLAAIEDMRR